MLNGRRTSLLTITGLVFTGICAAHAFVNIFINIYQGNGLSLLSNVVAVIALLGLYITASKYHDSEDMNQWPLAVMCLYLISNVFLIFGEHWTYALMLLPLAALVLLATVFYGWGLMGIIAGVLMIVLNIVGGMIIFHSSAAAETASALSDGKVSSMYLAGLLVSNNSLMGIACACFFCTFPKRSTYGGGTAPQEGPGSGGGFM